MRDDTAFQDWIDRAKATPIEDAAKRLNANLRGGTEKSGPCPKCGGEDRFAISTRKQVYLCRQGRPEGGGVVDMVMYVQGATFLQACEWLTGEAPPRGSGMTDEDRAEIAARARDDGLARHLEQRAKEQADDTRMQRRLSEFDALFQDGLPLMGSHGEAYYRARGINVRPEWCANIRFLPSHPLWGHGPDDPKDAPERHLGDFPTIMCAMRNLATGITALHLTWLHPDVPAKPKARKKKVMGDPLGSLIWLTRPTAHMIVGEGVETVMAYAQMHGRDGMSYACAYSIGNLCGPATGLRPHPTGAKQSIPNGIPDMDRPAMALPEEVETVTLLGDHEVSGAKPAWTYANLLTGARRVAAQGREALIHMAPSGGDFNDALVRAGVGLLTHDKSATSAIPASVA